MPHSVSITFKVVLVGSTGVGKSSILVRHKNHAFSHVSPTIGCSFTKSDLQIKNRTVQLQIWDTAGQERFRAMAPLYYRNSEGALAVYDITSSESFETMKTWINELKAKDDKLAVLCILGNKCDLSHQREVTSDVGKSYAESIGALFYETSALSNRGVEEAFLNLAHKLLQQLCPEYRSEDGPLKLVDSKISTKLCC